MISEIKMRKKSPPGDPVMRVLGHSILPHKSLKLSSLFKISFSLLVDWLSSTALSFKLTDYSSSSLLLVLLVPLVYFSVQLLYFFFFILFGYFLIFPISLLKFSLCLSTPVSSSFGIFMIITLNPFPGKVHVPDS